MSETAADLRDRLLPQAPYRQWVMSFPWPMRLPLAYDKTLFSKILNVFLRTVFAWQRHRGRRMGIADGQTGAVSFLQRMGGALNLKLPEMTSGEFEKHAQNIRYLPLGAKTRIRFPTPPLRFIQIQSPMSAGTPLNPSI